MQNIERQAQKKGIELKDYGRCQFCGSNTRGGVFECFDVFNDLAMNFMEGNNLFTFIYADAHCLQHSEVHGGWNNNLHLTRQYLILEQAIAWEYAKTSQLSNILDQYKRSHPDILIPALPLQQRGHLTVTDLIGLKQKELEFMVFKWAYDVYHSYDRYHTNAKVVGDLYINKYER
ncbi:DUF5946 family protein [Paenibacillus sp. OAE614]|uniref:DUF5946 family protein n=1 Tax=Paenibacillus sp. OAE614 TaxID=2663804 RepID=UPI00178AC1BE